MTEQEWLTSTDPAAMMGFIDTPGSCAGRAYSEWLPSERKLRLFADACRHSFYHGHLVDSGRWSGWESNGHMESRTRDESLPADRVARAWASEGAVGERPRRVEFLRDIVGNPFRPMRQSVSLGELIASAFIPNLFDRSWLSPTVLSIATTIYETCDFADMPILADALEDAGADSPDILIHLRSLGSHVRGCWVLDLVLGKP